jgi:hypothetical protein
MPMLQIWPRPETVNDSYRSRILRLTLLCGSNCYRTPKPSRCGSNDLLAPLPFHAAAAGINFELVTTDCAVASPVQVAPDRSRFRQCHVMER